jgi:hypothetical protein
MKATKLTPEQRAPLTLSSLAVLPPVAGSEDAEMGRQLTEQWERVKASRREDLIFGAMMLKVRERVVSACGHNSRPQRGPGSQEGSLKDWIDKHAPTVSRSVAYRLMEIAEGVQQDFKLGKLDLAQLLIAQVEGMDPQLATKRAQIEEVIEGKSQRQLLLEFGNAKPKDRGGARTTSPDKTYDPNAPIENARDLLLHPLRSVMLRWREKEAKLPLWAHLPPEELREIDGILLDLRADLKAALKTGEAK